MLGQPEPAALEREASSQGVMGGVAQELLGGLRLGAGELGGGAEEQPEARGAGAERRLRRQREIQLEAAREEEDPIERRAAPDVEQPDRLELVREPLRPLVQHRLDVDAVDDCEGQVEVGPAVALAVGEQADDCAATTRSSPPASSSTRSRTRALLDREEAHRPSRKIVQGRIWPILDVAAIAAPGGLARAAPRLSLVARPHDDHGAGAVEERAAKGDHASLSRPSMNAACSGQSGCSRAPLPGSHSGPAGRSTTNRRSLMGAFFTRCSSSTLLAGWPACTFTRPTSLGQRSCSGTGPGLAHPISSRRRPRRSQQG